MALRMGVLLEAEAIVVPFKIRWKVECHQNIIKLCIQQGIMIISTLHQQINQ